MNKQFTGIIPPVITCFGKDGKFDEAAQREVVSFQARHIDGFYPCGTYGSGPLMTTDERKRVAEVVINVLAQGARLPGVCPWLGLAVYAMASLRGIVDAYPRTPFVPATVEVRGALQTALNRSGVLNVSINN